MSGIDHRPLLYMAAPLFSEAELKFNVELASQLDVWYEVFLPQRDGGLLVELLLAGIEPSVARRQVFEIDVSAVKRCSMFVVVLDGRTIDEGAAFELGLAFSLGKTCVGLQTDPRRILPTGNNPMIECALTKICNSRAELMRTLRSLISRPNQADE